LLRHRGKKVAEITDISRPTINKIFNQIRMKIVAYCEKNSLLGTGEIELDQSYFGAKRVRGKRGRVEQKEKHLFLVF